jgi:energy-coupling factor transporter ATP-binding protein EcfA2
VIEIENISVTYKSGELRIPALSSVNLKIEKGEYLSILGPNGSGKSTLVKALCGLVTLDNGSIKINGAEISAGQFSTRLFGKVGVVFQEPSGQFLMPSVRREIESVLENLGLEYALQQERFNDIISEFELQKLLNVAPQNLIQ